MREGQEQVLRDELEAKQSLGTLRQWLRSGLEVRSPREVTCHVHRATDSSISYILITLIEVVS